jgi:hypothetical protein
MFVSYRYWLYVTVVSTEGNGRFTTFTRITMLSAIACPLNQSRDLLKMIRASAFKALDKHWTYGYSVVRPATTNKGIKKFASNHLFGASPFEKHLKD